MNESSLLARIFEKNTTLPPGITLPPGDDMAALRLDSGEQLLSAVDSIVENVHFKLVASPLKLIGRKAITRNLSDIAAMAAKPLCALVAVVLPRNFSESQALELFTGMQQTALQYDCPLVGGDIAMHDGPLICSVTVMALPGPAGIITRSGAEVGDHVYVTGTLGGSVNPDGTGRHLTFQPRIALALQLARQARINSMIDLSDGLGIDAAHVAAQSRVAIVLQRDLIPRTPGCDLDAAMGDGEDYELLFTAAPDQSIPESIDNVPITRIGIVRPGSGTVGIDTGDTVIDVSGKGWEHHG